MDVGDRVAELYLGERGLLFWSAQLAWYGSIGLVGAWVLFRIALPALGLYTLQVGSGGACCVWVGGACLWVCACARSPRYNALRALKRRRRRRRPAHTRTQGDLPR